MNMGYCRFENTASDLSDCVKAVGNYNEEMDQLSRHEEEAVGALACYAVELLENIRLMIQDKLGEPVEMDELINQLSYGDSRMVLDAVKKIKPNVD